MGGRGSGGRTGQYFTWNKKLFPGIGAGMKRGESDTDSGTYQEFGDVSRHSKGDRDWFAEYEYDGDGTKQIDFFKNNSNAYELIDKMTPKQREAFLAWASGEFMDGQQYSGWDNMNSREQAWTKELDKILDKSELKRGIIVTRDTTAELILGKGHKTGSLEDFKNAEGSIITSAGSMSTGAAKTGLGIGASGSKAVRVRIQIPAGAKGAGMWIGDSRIHGWGAKQLEFMTNRDSVFQVGKTVFDKSSGMYVVTVKWLGHKKHDYGTSGKRRNWV